MFQLNFTYTHNSPLHETGHMIKQQIEFSPIIFIKYISGFGVDLYLTKSKENIHMPVANAISRAD